MIEPIKVSSPESLNFLRPKIISNLYRVGDSADGGYAITSTALTNSEQFLCLGLGENWSFEREIHQVNPKARIDIYDDSVGLYFFSIKAAKGFVKFLFMRETRANATARFKRLTDYFQFWIQVNTNNHHKIHITQASFRNILVNYPVGTRIGLKIDIEGSEWDILKLIELNQSQFEYILIELHDFDRHESDLRDFLSGISDNFVLAHLHANNFETIGNNGFPKVFELTLIRKYNVVNSGLNRNRLPVQGLDVPNAKNRPDFIIEFPHQLGN
jgi:hypothetical protein